MKVFIVIDPTIIPIDGNILSSFDIKEIKSLRFYGQAIKIENNLVPQVVNPESLEIQYKAYKLFILKNCLRFENKLEAKLPEAEMKLKNAEKTKTILSVPS